MYLASHDNKLVSVNQLADIYRVSVNHMVKVVHNLVKINYLSSVRGRNGGVRLALAANEIRLGDAINDIENHRQIIDCSSINCILEPNCSLQSVLLSAQKTFYAELNKVTLADLCKNPTQIRQLLKTG